MSELIFFTILQYLKKVCKSFIIFKNNVHGRHEKSEQCHLDQPPFPGDTRSPDDLQRTVDEYVDLEP